MKMTGKNFVSESMERLQGYATQLEEGKTARDIAAEMYANGLADKTEETGYLMADRIVETIEEYHKKVEESIEDGDQFVRNEITKTVSGIESAAGRCKAYHNMLVAIAAYTISCDGSKAEAQAYVDQNKEFSMTEDEAKENEEKMLNDVVEAVGQANIALAAVPGMLAQAQDMDFDNIDCVFAYGRDSKDLKLLLSMQTYIDAQNNKIEDLNPGTTLEQITYSVSGAVDTVAIAEKTGDNDVTLGDVGMEIMGAIGRVVGVVLLGAAALPVALGGGIILGCLLPFPTLATIAIVTLGSMFILVSANAAGAARAGQRLFQGLGGIVRRAAGLVIRVLRWFGRKLAPIFTVTAQWMRNKLHTLSGWVYEHTDAVAEQDENETKPVDSEPVPAQPDVIPAAEPTLA